MGPRPFSHGNAQARRPLRQTQTSFNGAATFQSRELAALMDSTPSLVALQWGRDLSVTGTSEFVAPDSPPIKLQWGRDLSVTGTYRRVRCDVQGDDASMGPRPFSHGNPTPSRPTPSRPTTLQWGRDLSVTGTQIGAYMPDIPASLQWGRDLSVTGTCRGRRPA